MHLLRRSCIFSLFLWSVRGIDYQAFNPSWSRRANAISPWYFIFCMYCWFQTANILFGITASVFMSYIALVSLKSKTASYVTSKNGFIQEEQRIRKLEQATWGKILGKSSKQRRGTLFREEGGSREGLFGTKVHWRNSKSSEWWQLLAGWVAGGVHIS